MLTQHATHPPSSDQLFVLPVDSRGERIQKLRALRAALADLGKLRPAPRQFLVRDQVHHPPTGAVQIVLPDQTAALSCDAVDERTVALRDGERTVVCSASSSSTTQEESEAHLRESLAVAVAEQHKELKIVKPDGVDVGVTLCNTRATAQRERSRLMIRRHSDPGVRSLPAM